MVARRLARGKYVATRRDRPDAAASWYRRPRRLDVRRVPRGYRKVGSKIEREAIVGVDRRPRGLVRDEATLRDGKWTKLESMQG